MLHRVSFSLDQIDRAPKSETHRSTRMSSVTAGTQLNLTSAPPPATVVSSDFQHGFGPIFKRMKYQNIQGNFSNDCCVFSNFLSLIALPINC